MAQELVITLDRTDRWFQVVLPNKAHFVVSFPVDIADDEERTITVCCKRVCKHHIITKNERLQIPTGEFGTFDFPFLIPYRNLIGDEEPVDVYVEVGASGSKKLTFTWG